METKRFLVLSEDSNEGQLLLRKDLSHLDLTEVQVECEDDSLWIVGHKREEIQYPDCPERFTGHFEQRFDLPPSITADQLRAKFHEDILTIWIKKKQTEAHLFPGLTLNRVNRLWDKLFGRNRGSRSHS